MAMASLRDEVRGTDIVAMSLMRSPAADRNKDPLVQALEKVIPNCQQYALEIASGTGQHASYFSEHLVHVTWQPSECDEKSMQSIRGYVKVSQRKNLLDPVWIDTTQPLEDWANGNIAAASCDIILCINMIHVTEWSATEGLFKGGGRYLKPGAMLVTYGPYKIHGEITSESNVQYDQMLKQQCNEWGLRDIDDLEKLAEGNGMHLERTLDMPANNKLLVFKKES